VWGVTRLAMPAFLAALGPIDVGFLGAVGAELEPCCIAYLVEQLSGPCRQTNLQGSEVAQRTEL